MKFLLIILIAFVLALEASGDAIPVGRGESGELVTASIEFKWRTVHYTSKGPELLILATNRGDAFVRISFHWLPRRCEGVIVKATLEDSRAVRATLGMSPPVRELKPGDWVTIIFPLGVDFRPEPALGAVASCETSMGLQVHRRGKDSQVAEIIAPAHAPKIVGD